MFLPPERRQAITALYAFCREVDDVVDECQDMQIAHTKLDWWRQQVALVFDGEPQHPVGQALKDVSLALQPAPRATAGDHRRHADGPPANPLPGLEGPHLYCYRVASVVGLLSAEIFGYTNRQTLKYAHDLGLAFQLTNIIRDVGEDARRGRIYLPIDELQRFKVPAGQILDGQHSEDFRELMSLPGRARPPALRPGLRPAACRRPQGPAPGPDHGRHLPHPARRDRGRRLPGA
jgi:phytoene synthase